MSTRSLGALAALALASLALPQQVRAQTFDSGSDGTDGELTFAPGLGTVFFDPTEYSPRKDPDLDNVYHFTTITIGAGTTVRLTTQRLPEGVPVVWLATGVVTISGTLDLSGDSIGVTVPTPGAAGAGGYLGGQGAGGGAQATAGNGPGGGAAAPGQGGGGAGHRVAGTTVAGHASAGAAYGTDFLLPMVGGSGGGGNSGSPSAGGSGGGALLLASSGVIQVSGAIRAIGANPNVPAFGSQTGGAGSGGSLRLIAPRLEGSGTFDVQAGVGSVAFSQPVPVSSPGRVRLEAFRQTGTFTIFPPGASTQAPPGPVFPPATAPTVKAVRIAGVTVAPSPTGSFFVPDAVIDAAGPVAVELEANNVPAGTVLTLRFQPATGAAFTATSSPLVAGAAGQPLTATATVSFPSGHTRLFVQASWTP